MLYLASRSPRRQELLQRLDVPFQTLQLDVPELRAADESPDHYVQRVALDKAHAGLALVQAADPDAIVLGSDTEVVLGERVFGKPVDVDDAIAMLRALSGRTHQVLTAVVLVCAQRAPAQALVVSEVTFDRLDDAQIAAYAACGEPMGKAGAYAIQGRAERFIRHLSGSYSGVMGLPLYHTSQLLTAFGAH
ncbi:septum formation inhibitor Maf [Xanthomonas oryzae]|uniref:dTTP/UTP pyrophosphatase n=2 Tax=Xanthomonas oryzae TaxID=347 RepID=G7TLM9_XANOB|nr:Maf-like protein [Xanthomonas oryzae]AEQ95845.1 septum formation protein Maf [Xanthomonas oryzae pv. oryzicola BLS256]AJQ88207.1 septum formation inhibitor Maf [Xanthomonas oryzae pv. oryzicola]AKK63532.1 septum formation inhibitor Maf [Xanthomonas oryzae pv. oryzicola]AKN92882.1 septum formation inhibitor Maf [Xanthomonas oryzae pv. oryzicola]AKN96612.1 septum formation inhibitor Maf [Xanthomonas oryzae pv. oryzicola]